MICAADSEDPGRVNARGEGRFPLYISNLAKKSFHKIHNSRFVLGDSGRRVTWLVIELLRRLPEPVSLHKVDEVLRVRIRTCDGASA